MAVNTNIALAYYGDDFTGSTDALEVLTNAGLKTVLFINVPDEATIRSFDGLQAFGIAGTSRSLKPEEMKEELPPAFQAIKASGAKHAHYKVCSTFDSSPHIGSIGKATELGLQVFTSQSFVPLMVAVPQLGRYCTFGNLFARLGTSKEGIIYRLDRHPSMSKHPSTPSEESDLRLHLSKQTDLSTGLIDVLDLELAKTALGDKIEKENQQHKIILFDGINEQHLQKVGEVLENEAEKIGQLFSVGSSGIEYSLNSFWESQQKFIPREIANTTAHPKQTLILSGSCSPVTEKQISYALENGFKEVAINTTQLLIASAQGNILEEYILQAINYLKEGHHVIIHTSKGPNDPRIQETNRLIVERNIDFKTSEFYGNALGQISKEVIEQFGKVRLVIAGGDTSGYIAKKLEIDALEMIYSIVPGAPLCKTYSKHQAINHLEINFKGGQVGAPDYFLRLQQGI